MSNGMRDVELKPRQETQLMRNYKKNETVFELCLTTVGVNDAQEFK